MTASDIPTYTRESVNFCSGRERNDWYLAASPLRLR
jgi:hypothetical protein